ncbi:hypothetical protein EVAR_73686_1 [Eumeta japonica]|uniref:Uncharacterized protein n=1 Tax=Eumeta variegata TaxID=151549 RepID=A0A4C1TDF1_EUMVA|nr:hypothetical protein EVAR_73686_1 [Eumeta japonica]
MTNQRPRTAAVIKTHAKPKFLLAPVLPLSGDYYVSLAETDKAIFRLSKRKASGSDWIPTVAIKQLPVKSHGGDD